MTRLAIAALLAASLLAPPASAQPPAPLAVRGRFEDASTRLAVPEVQVRLLAYADTSVVHRATAGPDGAFRVGGLSRRSYWLEATRLGYARLRQVVRVQRDGQDLGTLALVPASIPVEGITVEESPAPATQKGDTTEYRAGAVKTHRDATAEDLVQKLPGVTLEGGQVKAHGEAVQNVLVNGRPFFGSDPAAAMRNLPAEVVDRIQVYDRMSDQAEFSGFDDASSQKTMNFILRDHRARFGRAYGGYGDRDRYQAGGSLTQVRGASRLSLIGMSNNVNQKNFTHQDLFGAMSGGGGAGAGGPRMVMMGGGGGFRRGGGGGGGNFVRMGGGAGGFGGGAFDPGSFLVSQQPGVSTTHSGGLNLVAEPGRRLTITGSVFANDTDTGNDQTLSREFIPVQDSVAFYEQRTTTDSRNRNQRVDARVEWTPDSLRSLILQPRLYFQSTRSAAAGDARNATLGGAPISDAATDTRETVDGDNLSARLTLRNRFAKPGRNVSVEVNAGRNRRGSESAQLAWTRSHGDSAAADTLDQIADGGTMIRSLSTRVAFTEPVAPGVQLQAIYNPSLTRSVADARTYRLDASGAPGPADSALSNSFRSRTTVQSGGLAALLRRGPWRLLGNLSFQETRLESEQTWPGARRLERAFGDFVPSATLTGSFAGRRNLRLAWNTSSNPPGIGQLQNVVNNSNPLALTTGNPALRPAYAHALSLRLSEADPATSRSRFLFLNLTRTADPIVSSTFTAPADTTIGGVFLARGTQLTRPVNLGTSWSGNLFAVVSRPVKALKSIVSLNGGGSWNRTPTELNGVASNGSNVAIRSGLVVSSNVSERLDFTVSYWGTYNIARNSRSAANGDYFTHSGALRLNSVIGPGIVVRQEVSHNLQSGVPSSYGQNLVLWNATLGKRFLKSQRGEIRVTATDALRQDRSVSRSVTESYVEDSRDRTLGRYVQAVLSYSFR